jgi:hypothetical protein
MCYGDDRRVLVLFNCPVSIFRGMWDMVLSRLSEVE